MGGLGIGEALLIGLIVGFMGLALLAGVIGLGSLRPGRGRGTDPALQERILEELQTLRIKLDALERRVGPWEGGSGPGDAGEADHE